MTKILAMLVLAGISITVHAQQGDGREACGPDVRQYCSSAVGGGAEQVTDCLIDHQKEISDACYDSLSKQQAGDAGSSSDMPVTQPAAAGNPIYRSLRPDGSILYTNIPQPNVASMKNVQFLGGNSSLPSPSSSSGISTTGTSATSTVPNTSSSTPWQNRQNLRQDNASFRQNREPLSKYNVAINQNRIALRTAGTAYRQDLRKLRTGENGSNATSVTMDRAAPKTDRATQRADRAAPNQDWQHRIAEHQALLADRSQRNPYWHAPQAEYAQRGETRIDVRRGGQLQTVAQANPARGARGVARR